MTTRITTRGPSDSSVLSLQSTHRTRDLWDSVALLDAAPMTIRRADQSFWAIAPDVRLLPLLRRAGFYGVARLGWLQLDHGLVTAMVERWREETHTFHLPMGEATITLEDVAVLLGLPVDGAPVTGIDMLRTTEERQALCQELLGVTPPVEVIHFGRLRLTWLVDLLNHMPGGDLAPHQLEQYARISILCMLGGHYLSDSSDSFVKLMYLPLLRDLDASGQLSWGSAVLAWLYRCLCRAAHRGARAVSGGLMLLQMWTWERIPALRPTLLDGAVPRGYGPIAGQPDLPVGPRGCRWTVPLGTRAITTHVVRPARDQLDLLREGQFVWQPYLGADVHDIYLVGQDIWRSRTPLICMDTVEMHLPDRVLRQFGLRQGVPPSCDTLRALHQVSRQGRPGVDWRVFHHAHIATWGSRRVSIVQGDVDDGQIDPTTSSPTQIDPTTSAPTPPILPITSPIETASTTETTHPTSSPTETAPTTSAPTPLIPPPTSDDADMGEALTQVDVGQGIARVRGRGRGRGRRGRPGRARGRGDGPSQHAHAEEAASQLTQVDEVEGEGLQRGRPKRHVHPPDCGSYKRRK